MSFQADIANDVEAACGAHKTFTDAFQRFHTASKDHNFKTAELAREIASLALDAYFNHVTAQHMRIKSALHGE